MYPVLLVLLGIDCSRSGLSEVTREDVGLSNATQPVHQPRANINWQVKHLLGFVNSVFINIDYQDTLVKVE
jgi:hypothetical protein